MHAYLTCSRSLYIGLFTLASCSVAAGRADVTASVLEPVPVRVLPKHSDKWIVYPTVTSAHLVDFKPQLVPTGTYGGRLDRREEATGFFHAKKLGDRWILVDPEGYHFYSVGVCIVQPADEIPDSRYAFRERFGSYQRWAETTYQLLTGQLGFNTLGSWSDGKGFNAAGRPMPYLVRLDIISKFAREYGLHRPSYGSTNLVGDVLPVFYPEFPDFVDRACRVLLETRDDPWVLGIQSDNEIPLFEENIIQRYLARGEDDAGAQRARAWLSERGKTPDAITAEDDREFCLLVLRTYFRMVKEGIRKYDPNHLYIGTRFHKSVLSQTSAYEAAAPYMDVVTINLYHRWNIDQAEIDAMAAIAGKPLMITEWYAKGMDSGLRNVSGAGFLVETQEERGMFYENFTISLLRNPNIVGWHWFRYMDEGPLRHGHQASNKGLVNVHYEPYAPLTDAAARINRQAYALRDYLLQLESPHLPDTPGIVVAHPGSDE